MLSAHELWIERVRTIGKPRAASSYKMAAKTKTSIDIKTIDETFDLSMPSKLTKITSKASSKVSKATKHLQAQVQYAKRMLELEKRQYEKEKELFRIELELEKAQIEEEHSSANSSQNLGTDDEQLVDSFVYQEEPRNDPTELHERVQVTQHSPISPKRVVANKPNRFPPVKRSEPVPEPQVSNSDRAIEKLLARQSYGKKLINFSGDPLEWQGFKSQYQESTNRCDFTNSDNLIRLQDSLKGIADR